MNQSLRVWKVYFKENIGTPENYIGSANVIAGTIGGALEIANSYGPVTAIHGDEGCVITAKREQVSASAEQPPPEHASEMVAG